MSKGDFDPVKAHFAASTRDLTPVSVRGAVHVLFAPLSLDPGVSRNCASVLSADELCRSDQLVAQIDKALFLQRRAFRRVCGAIALATSRPLSQIRFEETAKGRPFLTSLPDTWFSFSSCSAGFLGAWSSTLAVGVDLEDQAKNLEASELANHFFSEDEARAVKLQTGPHRLQTFFRLWSLKEAALKSIGEGLPYGLDAFEFELAPQLRMVDAPPVHGGPGQFSSSLIEGTGLCAAMVTRSPVL